MGQIFDSSIHGGQYILPPDVKPHSGGVTEWRNGLVISTTKRNTLINNYRAGRDKRLFPIFKDDVTRLIAAGQGKKIMLRVENLQDPSSVYIAWMAYNPAIIDTNHFDYFIIEEKFFNGKNPPDEPDGILASQGDVLVASIAKEGNKFSVIINQLTGFVNNPGGGGDPPGVGSKVPSGGS